MKTTIANGHYLTEMHLQNNRIAVLNGRAISAGTTCQTSTNQGDILSQTYPRGVDP